MNAKSLLRRSRVISAVKLDIFPESVTTETLGVPVTSVAQEVPSATSAERSGTSLVTVRVEEPPGRATEEEEEVALEVMVVGDKGARLVTLAVDTVICPGTAPRGRSATTAVKLDT